MEKGRLVHSEFIFIKMHRFLGRIKIDRQCQKKRQVLTCRFFNEINPFRICEMHFEREILLRNMKYACGV